MFNFTADVTPINTCCDDSKAADISPTSTVTTVQCNDVTPATFRQDFASAARPLLLNGCLQVCPAHQMSLAFVCGHLTEKEGINWTIEDPKTGKIKRIKSDQVSANLGLIQTHISNLEPNLIARNLILDSRNATGPKIRDLFVELGVLPISHLTIQHWKKDYGEANSVRNCDFLFSV